MRILKIATIAAVLFAPALAQAQIKQPGAHPHYSVELEPHFVFGWAGGPRFYGDEGIGAGLRASIPFIDNGPIDTINNNMGITFGLDYLYYDFDNCYYYGLNFNLCNNYDFSAHAFWLPVAMQWNFFVHRRISVFGEVGLAIEHVRFNWVQACPPGVPGPYCEYDDSDTRLRFLFYPGARFMLADTVGITVRVGYPHLTAGVSFLL
jgi:hypothetical protein